MFDDRGEISFYVDLDAGQLDHRLGSLYAELMAEGDVFQASEVARRALSISEGSKSQIWSRRLQQRADEMLMFGNEWLPNRLLQPVDLGEPTVGTILGFFKSSLPHSRAGYTFRTQKTLEAQQRAGFHVVPCTPLGFGEGADEVEAVGNVEYRRLRLPQRNADLGRTEALELNALALLKVASQVNPQLIHAASGFYGPDMGLVALAVATQTDRPFVYEMRGLLPETWAYAGDGLKVQRQTSWMRWSQELRLSREASVVIVLGDSMREELQSNGIPGEKIHVIPNGVDVESFDPDESRPNWPAAIQDLDQTMPTVGYISNLGEREGHRLLLEAVAKLRDSSVPLNCVIVGDGPMRQELEFLSRGLGIEELVRLVGPVPQDEVVGYYSALDAFVVPRLDDRAARYTTPLKPYEAMAMKVPVVASDLPALLEIVGRSEERGFTFYCGSSDSLAKTISRILADPHAARAKAEKAYEWVVENRQWEHNVGRYRKAFDQALSVS